ncbi:hypothetical protein HQ535_10485 [bacterium]|nr:hypothetical protein [bacterium]
MNTERGEWYRSPTASTGTILSDIEHEPRSNDYEIITGEGVVDEMIAFLRSDKTPSLRGPVMLHYFEDRQGLFSVELIEWRSSFGQVNLEFGLRPHGQAAYHDLSTVAFTIAIDRKAIGRTSMYLSLDDTATPEIDFEGGFEPGADGEPFEVVRGLLQLALDSRPTLEEA